jgi:hypothetical protein
MAYTKKVMSGRTYWYKDGKRIAAAKVPANVKNGKKPSGKKPSSKKNGNGRKPSAEDKAMVKVRKECHKASKGEIMELLNTLTKDELCKLVDQIPRTPDPVSKSIERKALKYLKEVERNRNPDPNACDDKPMPRCFGRYCGKSGRWECPKYDPEVIHYAGLGRRATSMVG